MRDCDSIARDLEAVVRLIKPNEKGQIRADEWRFRRAGLPFPKGADSIHVARVPGIEQSVWYPSSSFFVPPLTVHAVTELIGRKDEKVPRYRERCDEAWLVIAIENFSASGAWDLEDFPWDHRFTTVFDRLFLHDVFSARVHELKRVT